MTAVKIDRDTLAMLPLIVLGVGSNLFWGKLSGGFIAGMTSGLMSMVVIWVIDFWFFRFGIDLPIQIQIRGFLIGMIGVIVFGWAMTAGVIISMIVITAIILFW